MCFTHTLLLSPPNNNNTFMQSLLDAKTVSITHLLAISQPGTVDPTPMLYDTTMYVRHTLTLWLHSDARLTQHTP
jgi:hypothetical protein